MKNNVIKLMLLLCLTGFWSCDENSPVIPCLSCGDGDVTVEPTDKKILVEEFTGVRCVNCPAGSAEIENLLDIHGERMIAVSIHAGFFSTPYLNSNVDFRTSEGTALEGFLDAPLGYPTAVINRKLFENQDDLQLSQASWAGLIQQEKSELSPLVLDLTIDFDEASRELTATTKIQPAETLTGDYRYSVMVIESGVKDPQLTPDNGVVDDYSHKHVLRDMMTPFNGEDIEETFTVGTTVEKVHQMTLPDDYESTKVSVIVIVHKDGDSREVVQVEEKGLAD